MSLRSLRLNAHLSDILVYRGLRKRHENSAVNQKFSCSLF
jgi:hypothetical protein